LEKAGRCGRGLSLLRVDGTSPVHSRMYFRTYMGLWFGLRPNVHKFPGQRRGLLLFTIPPSAFSNFYMTESCLPTFGPNYEYGKNRCHSGIPRPLRIIFRIMARVVTSEAFLQPPPVMFSDIEGPGPPRMRDSASTDNFHVSGGQTW
jgi:hypothetical protein